MFLAFFYSFYGLRSEINADDNDKYRRSFPTRVVLPDNDIFGVGSSSPPRTHLLLPVKILMHYHFECILVLSSCLHFYTFLSVMYLLRPFIHACYSYTVCCGMSYKLIDEDDDDDDFVTVITGPPTNSVEGQYFLLSGVCRRR